VADGLPLWNFRMWCGVVGWCAVTNPVGRYRKRSWTGSCVTACGHRPRVSPRAGDSWCWTTRPMSPGSAMSYWDIDTGFTSLLMLLTAVDAGLGACFFGFPVDRIGAFRAAFEVPERFTPIGAISVGYSDEPPTDVSDRRKPLADVVHSGRWGHPLE